MIVRRLLPALVLLEVVGGVIGSRAAGAPGVVPDIAITPSFPRTVVVGQASVPASVLLTSSALVPTAVSAVTLAPSCEEPADAGACNPVESLVVSSTARGSGGGCEGVEFAVTGPDGAGRVLFSTSSPVVLAPVVAARCTIGFTIDAVKGPPTGRVAQAATLTVFPGVPSLAQTVTGRSTVEVTRAAPVVRASTRRASADVGSATASEVTVTAGGMGTSTPPPGGAVVFRLFGPDDGGCTGAPATTSEPRSLSAGRATSPPFTLRQPGAYRWVAGYEGDLNYGPASSGCGGDGATVVVRGVTASVPTTSPPATAPATPAARAGTPAGVPAPVPARPASPAPARSGGHRAYARFDPIVHADEVVHHLVVAFVLLSVVLGAAAAGVRAAGAGSGAGSGSGPGSGSGVTEVVSMEVGVPEAGAVLLATQALERGDRSGTWRWPATEQLDKLSLRVPRRLAPASPLLARVLNDGGYLRATLGSAWVLVPLGSVALGVLAVADTSGQALPPRFWLLMAIAVVGVFDAFAGFLAVTVFVLGVTLMGGLSSAGAVRTVLALSLLWFAAPLIAGASRPLRREPTRTIEEHWDRMADIVIASLIGAWAVQGILQALPTVSGLALPVAEQADVAALVVLGALAARMILETVAAHWYPARLAMVQAPELPGPRTGQRLAAKLLTLAIFVFVAASYVGLCWQLVLGAALFIVPQLLELLDDRLPNFPKLHTALPQGIVQIVLLLFVTAYIGAFAVHAFRQSEQLIRSSFLLLALPGFVFAVLGLFGREGHKPTLRWRHQLAGVLILAIGVLFVVGVIGV
jgi:hypothetical protein